MNKILRISMIAVLALIANFSFGQAYKTLTFPDDNKDNNKVQAYNETWTAKISTDTWSIKNFNNNYWNNNWKWIKCGSKKNASVGTITTDFAIDKAISYVVVNIDNIQIVSSVNSIKLEVTSDKEGNTVLETVNLKKIAAGDAVFTITTPKENCYYKLSFDCKQDKNGLITVSKVEYYQKGTSPNIVDISNTPETAYTVAKAKELIDAGEGLSTEVYVKGIVTSVGQYSDKYKSLTYNISDDGEATNELNVYSGKYLEGADFTSADQVKAGDKVIVKGKLKKFNDTYEIDMNSKIYSLNGVTTGINNITTDATLENAPAFNLAGQKVGKAYKGVVIKAGKKFIQK
nr:hypothetical protein [Prevotella sp.]